MAPLWVCTLQQSKRPSMLSARKESRPANHIEGILHARTSQCLTSPTQSGRPNQSHHRKLKPKPNSKKALDALARKHEHVDAKASLFSVADMPFSFGLPPH